MNGNGLMSPKQKSAGRKLEENSLNHRLHLAMPFIIFFILPSALQKIAAHFAFLLI